MTDENRMRRNVAHQKKKPAPLMDEGDESWRAVYFENGVRLED